jgi:hypothetical protein
MNPAGLDAQGHIVHSENPRKSLREMFDADERLDSD